MAHITTYMEVIKSILTSTRMKSFYWRTGMMVLAVIINQGIVLVSSSSLTSPMIIVLGLILGELSKSIANSLKEA